jgi:hypothetical protein
MYENGHNTTPGRPKPGKLWLLIFPMAAFYASLYLGEKDAVTHLGDWIGWTVGMLGFLVPPFILGFMVGAEWTESRGNQARLER